MSELIWIAHLFAKRMRLDNHQWVAVAHKDIDNRYIHIIANRISLYGEVYETTEQQGSKGGTILAIGKERLCQ